MHPPEQMPFDQPWTDADPRHLGRGTLQYYWATRAALNPRRWSVHFLVRLDGRVIGVRSMSGEGFAVTREVSSGSWLGMAHQGRGLSTEMRAAMLMVAFDHLGARAARSAAFVDNPASLAVSRTLGYLPDGMDTRVRRGEPAEEVRLLLTADPFAAHRPPWTVRITGLDACLSLLSAR